MSRKQTKSASFLEAYEVSLDYQKPDGYWVRAHKEAFYVNVRHGRREKCNHRAAEDAAKKKYPGCKINCVAYI